MQTYLNVRAINVGNDTTQGSRGADPARAIPIGRETSATVVQVSQSQSQPGQFTLQLQIGNRTLELATPRPFPQGSQVILSRDAQGNIQLQLPTNNTPTTPPDASRLQSAPAQARADAEALLMRITSGSLQQAANLPLNQPQKGIVLTQPSGGSQTSVNSNTQVNSSPQNSSAGLTTNSQAPSQTPSQAPSQAPASMNNTAQNTTSSSSTQPIVTGSGLAVQTNATTATTNQPAVGPVSQPQTSSAVTATTSQTTASTNQAASGPQSNSAAVVATNLNATNAAAVVLTQNSSNPASGSATNVATNASAVAITVNSGTNIAPAANQAAIPTTANMSNVSANNATIASGANVVSSANSMANVAVSQSPSLTASATANFPSTTATLLTAPTSTSTSSPLTNMISANEAVTRPQGFPVRVLVAGQVIDLVSPRPVQSGQQVDVSRNEQGLIRIQFSQPTTPLAQQPAIQAVMQQTLREVLPVQLPLADGLNQLMQISERQGAKQNNALNQLIQSMLSLFSVKPGSADADKAIARNLQQGGLLSEAGLSKPGQQPLPDLKQQLGQLLKVAEQLPTVAKEQLNQLVNSLLARSTAQQISSLQGWRDLPDGGQERHYRLDLPIQQQKGFENAELRITEHRRRNEEGEFVTLWTVRLHFELEQEGAMDAELSLHDRFQLNANFWVERPETLERLRERLNNFEQELKSKGFDVAPLNARLGKLENLQVTPLSKRLVDIHT